MLLFTESITDKTKVSFQVDRTTYHEVPEESDTFNEDQRYDEHGNEYRDDQAYDQNEEFQEDQEKFEGDEQYNDTDEQYQDGDFRERERKVQDQLEFEPEQPKLTPKQRWHRAYNKIVMQMNVSHFYYCDDESRSFDTFLMNTIFFHTAVFFECRLIFILYFLMFSFFPIYYSS